MLAIYPVIVILLCDIAVIYASILWFEAGGERAFNPIRAWQPLLTRMAVYCVFAYFIVNGGDETGLVSTCGWYAVLIAAVCHAFYAILQTLHLKNPTWLAGTDGKVGIPNWISIMRIALSLLVPHLYAAQPLGEVSCTIGTIVLVVAMLSDAIDGFFARKLHAFTKAGKALDPLGDKVVFYPVFVAFLIATNGTAYLTSSEFRTIFYVSFGIMLLRDLLNIIWFSIYYKKLPEGIGACLVDKIRMVAICVLLGLIAIMLTFPQYKFDLAVIGLADLVAIAILSIISVIVNYGRVEYLFDKNS